jgi:chromosome segregation ATPase
LIPAEARGAAAPDDIRRLRSELEQAHVALEDMDERMAELVRINAELSERLREQSRLREQAELRAEQLIQHAEAAQADRTEETCLRQELSVTLEELRVMQEELQTAHDALAAAQPAVHEAK